MALDGMVLRRSGLVMVHFLRQPWSFWFLVMAVIGGALQNDESTSPWLSSCDSDFFQAFAGHHFAMFYRYFIQVLPRSNY